MEELSRGKVLMRRPRHRLLLVEDHPDTRRLLRRMLTIRGWDVLEAATMAEGLAQLDPPPDCIVLDLMLPDGGGETILRRVRIEGLPTRVVVNTGTDDPARLNEVSYMRPDAVLPKPLSPEGLRVMCEPPMPN